MRYLPMLVIWLMVFSISPLPAHAYLDPGTGSVLLQGLIAAFAAVAATAAFYWRKMVGFIRGYRSNARGTDTNSN
jgi:uncharacterized membrane protein